MPDLKSYLYWIHTEEHSDFTKEGYIGVTTRTPEIRFNQHITAHKLWKDRGSGKDGISVLRRAISKYGKDRLILTTLAIGNKDDVYLWEENARPSPCIGWNIVKGGEGRRRITHSHEKCLEALRLYFEEALPTRTIEGITGICSLYVNDLTKGNYRKEVFEEYTETRGHLKLRREGIITEVGGKKKYTDEELLGVLDMYFGKQLSMEEIMNTTGMPEFTIRGLCNGFGRKRVSDVYFEANPDAKRKLVFGIQKYKNEVVTLIFGGKSVKEVMEITGMKASTIRTWAIDSGYVFPNTHTYRKNEEIKSILEDYYLNSLPKEDMQVKYSIPSVGTLNHILAGRTRKKLYLEFKTLHPCCILNTS